MKKKYASDNLKIYTEYTEQNITTFDAILPITDTDYPFEILVANPTDERPYYILVTEGVGTKKMDVPENYPSRVELIIHLPKDWKFDFEDKESSWVFDWLKSLSKIPLDNNSWLGSYHTIGSYQYFSGFKGFFVLPYLNMQTGEIEEKEMKLSNGEVVNFLSIIPLYDEELEYKKKFGGLRLLKELRDRLVVKDFMICKPNRKKAFKYDRLSIADFEKQKHTRIPLENPEEIIKFEDEGFEQMVRQLYGLEGTIRHKDIGYQETLITNDGLILYGDYVDIPRVELDCKVKTLKDLKWFTNLIELGLHGDPGSPIFFGDLADIVHLKRMVMLNTGGVILKGDLSELKSLIHLKEIVLTGQGIKGKLTDVKEFTALKTLYICDTKVTGDLADVTHLINLTYLTLSISKFTGDIKDLVHLKNLDEFDVSSSKIKGDIKHLKALKNLKEFRVDETKIGGDLADIANLTDLQAIYLQESKIKGDFSALKNLTELRTISLSDTKIKGDLDFLVDFKCLHDLQILDTGVNPNQTILESLAEKGTWIDVIAYKDYEDDDEEDEDDDEADNLYVQILHKKIPDGFEFYMLFQLDDEKAKIRYGTVGKEEKIEFIDWNVDEVSKILKEKFTEGFEDYDDKLQALIVSFADYPHINPESLVDTVQNELTVRGIGYVEEYKVEDTLQILCKVIDTEISKTILKAELEGYGIDFLKVE